MARRTNILVVFLVLIIVVLAGVLIYAFVIAPSLTGYVVGKQNEGVQIAINSILLQVQQNGFVQIPVGENQTLFLAPFNPQQAQAPTPLS